MGQGSEPQLNYRCALSAYLCHHRAVDLGPPRGRWCVCGGLLLPVSKHLEFPQQQWKRGSKDSKASATQLAPQSRQRHRKPLPLPARRAPFSRPSIECRCTNDIRAPLTTTPTTERAQQPE